MSFSFQRGIQLSAANFTPMTNSTLASDHRSHTCGSLDDR
jgi:hypothetical protein